jgi:hypothetical protein
MSALLAKGHFIPRSLEESFKKAMEIYIKTIKEMNVLFQDGAKNKEAIMI